MASLTYNEISDALSTEVPMSSASSYVEPFFNESIQHVLENPAWTAGLGSSLHSAYRGYKEARANGSSVLGSLDNFALGGISGVTRIALTSLLAGTVAISAAGGVAIGVAVNEGFNVLTKSREENMRLDRMHTVSSIPIIANIRTGLRNGLKSLLPEEMGERLFPEDIDKESYLRKTGVQKFLKAIKITQSRGQVKNKIFNEDGTPKKDINGKEIEEFPYQNLRDSLSAYIPGYDQDDINETSSQGIIENILRKAVNTEGGLLAGKSKKEVLKAIEDFGNKLHVYDDATHLLSEVSLPATTTHSALTKYVLFQDVKNAPLLKNSLLYEEKNADGSISTPIVDKLAEIADFYLGTASTSVSRRPEGEIIADLNAKKNTLLAALGGLSVSTAALNTKKAEISLKINHLTSASSLADYDTRLADVYSIPLLPDRIAKSDTDKIAEARSEADTIKNNINSFSYPATVGPTTRAVIDLNAEKLRLISAIDSCFSGRTFNSIQRSLLALSSTHPDLLPIFSPLHGAISGISDVIVDREAQDLNSFLTSFSGEMGTVNRFESGHSASSLDDMKNKIKRDPYSFITGIPNVHPDRLQSTIFNSFLLSREGVQFKKSLEEELEKESFVDLSSLPPRNGGMRAFNEKHDTALGGKKYGVVGIMQSTRNLFSSALQKKYVDKDGNEKEMDWKDKGANFGGNVLNWGSTILAGKELFDLAKKFKN